jgi:hypothetical protein
MEGAQRPGQEWDSHTTRQKVCIVEEAGRREDTKKSGLQPSLYFFRALLQRLLERATVALHPHNPFAGWDTGSAGDSL